MVYTDTNPLSYLYSAKLGATKQCWVTQLAIFDYEIKHRPFQRFNGNAVSLLRQYSSCISTQSSGTLLPKTLRTADICQEMGSELVGVEQHAIAVFPFHSEEELQWMQLSDPQLLVFLMVYIHSLEI